jgi:site-specific DNA-methyltransferase (adenine-specific)
MNGLKKMPNISVRAGDALMLLGEVPSASIDLVIADPPYNLRKDYGNDSDSREFEEYLQFSRAWITECRRVMKPTATIYVFMGVRFISYIYDILERDQGLRFNSWICWHYTQGMGKTKGFSPRHDDVLMFNASDTFQFNLDDVRVPQKYYRERNNMRGANPGDVWSFSHVHYSHPNRQDHPTQKPEGLIERMVRASSNSGDLVLDPFAGSGTTARVCQQLERNCIAFELNPQYVDLVERRLAAPFSGFDSIDPRMERVPLDLRRPEIREAYLRDHEKWFLDRHENAVEDFRAEVQKMYGPKAKQDGQLSFEAVMNDESEE